MHIKSRENAWITANPRHGCEFYLERHEGEKMNTERKKYPRTFHLPYSLTISDDDKRLSSDDIFKSMDKVYCSIKMDGENTTVYPDGYIHARSLDGNRHPWQSLLKHSIQRWYSDIPEGWRVCGENLYAAHSIKYNFPDESYLFQVFGIYDEKNNALSYEDMCFYADLFGIRVVPVFFIGKYDKEAILNKFEEYKRNSTDEVEGFVVRNYDSFNYSDFSANTGKFVRKNHVTTDEHWTENWTKNIVLG